MHLLWLKMYAPTVEAHSSAANASDDFEEASRLVEESLETGDDIESASAMLSSPSQRPSPSATRIRRVPPSPTMSVGAQPEELALADTEMVPARPAKRPLAALPRKVARS